MVEAFGYALSLLALWTYFIGPGRDIVSKQIYTSSFCRYTLGGFFLANYDDSPAGIFDEVLYFNFNCFLDTVISCGC